MARDALIQLSTQNRDLIPLIWQMSDPQSPGANARFELYAGEEYPLGVFNGSLYYTGEDSVFTQYENYYDELTGQETPWMVDIDFGFDENENYLIESEITLEDSVEMDAYKLLIALTWHDGSNYSSLVLNSTFQDTVTISEAGEVMNISQAFPYEDYFDFSFLRAVVLVQNIETREIMQAAQTGITQLLPDALVNMNSGPASLGIYFTNNSFPQSNDLMFAWDFQNDGIIDSYEEDPYFVYEETGVFDVKLTISNGENEVERIFPELITVELPEAVEGAVTGEWTAQYSPYVIADDISIPYYGELVIGPGTEVIVEYNAKINVYGRFVVTGSADDPVILTSDTSWKGIKFLNSEEDNSIDYAEISNSSLAAINASFSNLDINNTIFYNNNSGSLGASLNLLGCENVTINRSIFTNNYSSMTGGIAMRSSHPYIYNSIFVNNEGSMAGALVIREDSDPVFINNVIANNSAPVAAIFVDESTPQFTNNIMIDEDAVFLGSIQDMRLDYNLATDDLGGNNFMAEPMFVNPTEGSGTDYDGLDANWQIMSDSPAVDAGNPEMEYNDPEDPDNPGYALYPAMGTTHNDIGAYGGPGIYGIYTDSEEDSIPSANASIAVYPNPFTFGKTRSEIQFDISTDEEGILKIYNLKGQEINTLKPNRDDNSFSWNGNDSKGKRISSGIYLVRWKGEKTSASGKLVFLR